MSQSPQIGSDTARHHSIEGRDDPARRLNPLKSGQIQPVDYEWTDHVDLIKSQSPQIGSDTASARADQRLRRRSGVSIPSNRVRYSQNLMILPPASSPPWVSIPSNRVRYSQDEFSSTTYALANVSIPSNRVRYSQSDGFHSQRKQTVRLNPLKSGQIQPD